MISIAIVTYSDFWYSNSWGFVYYQKVYVYFFSLPSYKRIFSLMQKWCADSVLMNLVKHQVLENTRDACIFSLPSMVRFLLVLAWVVIQGEIKTWSILFALFKLVQCSCWNYFAFPTITNFSYPENSFFYICPLRQYCGEENPEYFVQCVWLLHAVFVTISHCWIYVQYFCFFCPRLVLIKFPTSSVHGKIEEGKKTIEKELKDHVKLYSWEQAP